MNRTTGAFYNSIENAGSLSPHQRIDFFVYFLTVELEQVSATVAQLRACFDECDLTYPSSASVYLTRGLTSRPPKFVKVPTGGYRLEKHYREKIASLLGAETQSIDIPSDLRALIDYLPQGRGRDWFKEALDCFGIEAYRAAMIMVWIFVLDHLFQYVISHGLVSFNKALAQHPQAKKISQISSPDDFTIIREETFIEICATSRLISSDVKKILITSLGVRNSAAHPSGISLPRAKVVSIIEDLLTNVVLKYRLT